MIPLLGYADKLSARPGDTIAFKVSSDSDRDFDVQLLRIICADPNPAGPGIIQQKTEASINGSYPSRVQPFYPGSYARIKPGRPIAVAASFALRATIFPTLMDRREQVVLSVGHASLLITRDGHLAARLGDHFVRVNAPLRCNRWYRDVEMRYCAISGVLAVGQQDCGSASVSAQGVAGNAVALVTIAATMINGVAANHFNGKIESPQILAGPDANGLQILASWDFSRGISSTHIEDTGPNALHGELINVPTRAVTGSNWDGREMCWRHAPGQYGAIHFHEDDIYDFHWETDFCFTIPDSLPSGIYAAQVSCGDHEDTLPFFVCPQKGRRQADLCVLVATFTYAIYGNHARPEFDHAWHERTKQWNAYPWNPAEHREYGLSAYNTHTDGSGICHASHRRPLFNLRPGYLTFSYGVGSGLRHFQADSHLIAWLHKVGCHYDIVTDRELHDDGVAAIAGYKAVTTGTHPEYHTSQTLDALQNYRDNGGRLMYLGGNGFYWRIGIHQSERGVLEIRRGEGGVRAWASEPGEYYNAFDGCYGGLWRRSARAPQQLVGIGFSAQGEFSGAHYVCRTGDEAPACSAWLLAGIDGEIIGDFGLSGGGAAGYELDRVDHRLGSPDNIQIVASSTGHDHSFILVPEEQLTHLTNWPGGPTASLLRADMVYFEVPGGGEVFSSGSITFCGSLPHNNFDNNIATLLQNVLHRFLR